VRFTLIDRITAIEPGTSLKAVKNLSLAEEYLADHFPGFPVMPGVLMVESLVQAGAWLMRHTENFQYSAVLLKEARAIRFNNFVAPGKTLLVECSVHKRDERTYTLKGTGTVDGTSAVSAKLTLEQFNLADNNPDLRASDERRISKLRTLFDALYHPIDVTTGA
jgi:3-hydroxyacyl-[acyl-carrier-protein] dehydratase